MFVWDAGELLSKELPDQAQILSILVVGAMLAVKWFEAYAGTSEQEMAVPTPEQLNKVSVSKDLDLFKTTCKVPRLPRAIKRIGARQRLIT